MGAVESVYNEYKGRIEQQHDQARNLLHVQLATPQMQGRFRFVDSGLEFVVRYPVEMRRAAEIDDKITRALLLLCVLNQLLGRLCIGCDCQSESNSKGEFQHTVNWSQLHVH